MATSVATVHMEDTNDAQRVGKFMCVVPPKVSKARVANLAKTQSTSPAYRVSIV